MTTILHRPPQRHGAPDLFDWLRERELRLTDPAARKLADRFGLPIHIAATIARNAGLGAERCQ